MWCTVINHGSCCCSYPPSSYKLSSGTEKGRRKGSNSETPRVGNGAPPPFWLLPGMDTWTLLRVCLSLFLGLSQARKAPADGEGLWKGGEKGKKLPEILPSPPYHPQPKVGQKPSWEAEGLGCHPCLPIQPVTLGKSLCLSRPELLYLDSGFHSP